MVVTSLFHLVLIVLIIFGLNIAIKGPEPIHKIAAFMASCAIVLFLITINPKSEEFKVQVRVISLAPETNQLGVVASYNFTVFDGNDTLKVTAKEAQTFHLNDTILVKKMVTSSKITKDIYSVEYSY